MTHTGTIVQIGWMLVRRSVLLLFLFLAFTMVAIGQEKWSPVLADGPVFFTKTVPLRDLTPIPPQVSIAGKEEIKNENNPPWMTGVLPDEPGGPDQVLQDHHGQGDDGGIIANFEGLGNLQNKIPPDTEGDIGPDHYLQMINMSFAIFDRVGNILFGPAANVTVWQNTPTPWANTSNGDPIALYDQAAGRWLISELSFPHHPLGPYYIKIAVSATGDPLGSWYLYGYEYDYFCDYPKFGIWHDGYYLTTNNNEWVNSQWDFHAVGLSVFERDSMLAGSPNAQRFFYDFYPNQQYWSMLPADVDGTPPPEGQPCYLACYKEGTPDKIFIFDVTTDWQNINNSAVQLISTLLPTPFSGSLPNGVSQPQGAPYLASLSNRLMYRLQYRTFPAYQCLVANHTVNRGDGIAGIRWYEFRDAGSGWEIYQEGTYSPDSEHRWMGSIAMDGYGNMALGYSVASTSVFPSIRYTGRMSGDPPGIMTLAEGVIMNGTGVQLSSSHRWGDYSAMSVDPLDQCTFWYTQQYYAVTGDKTWQTRIASLHLNDYLMLTVSAGADTLCAGDSLQLSATTSGGSGNYTFSWVSDPPGFQSGLQNPVTFPLVGTTYVCTVDDGVNVLTEAVSVVVNPAPVVYAGGDTLITEGNAYLIEDSQADNCPGLEWATQGDGNFDDNLVLHPVYMPGPGDISTGKAVLSLTGFPLTGCAPGIDSMNLFIDPATGHQRKIMEGEEISILADQANKRILIDRSACPVRLVRLKIFNLLGEKLADFAVPDPYGRDVIEIDLSRLPGGMFILSVEFPDYRKAFKLVLR